MRVLLAIDGSAGAATAAGLVENIHWPVGTCIEVVRALWEGNPDVIFGPSLVGFPAPRNLDPTVVQDAEEYLLAAVEPLRKLGLQTSHAILRGRPADAILDLIDRRRPDLVVVGTRGESELTQAILGSVSAELVDRSPVPVLVARRSTLDRVVVAVDGSAIAAEAIATVRRWPFLAMTAVRTLSVAPEPVMWWPDELATAGRDHSAHVSDAAADAVLEHDTIAADAAAALRSSGFEVDADVRSGSPAPTIVAFTDEWKADLVILGSHGRTGLARMLLGSVARSVLHHASCSVLVVRRQADPVRGARPEAVAPLWTLVSTH